MFDRYVGNLLEGGIAGLVLVGVLRLSNVSGCTRETAPPPAPPPPPEHVDGASCSSACDNIAARGCSGELPLPQGATCVQVCENAERNALSFGVSCFTAAETCAAVKLCGTSSPR